MLVGALVLARVVLFVGTLAASTLGVVVVDVGAVVVLAVLVLSGVLAVVEGFLSSIVSGFGVVAAAVPVLPGAPVAVVLAVVVVLVVVVVSGC